MARLTDINKIGNALKAGILNTKFNLEKKLEETDMVGETELCLCPFAYLFEFIHGICCTY
jgi:hypothetical protein